MRDLAFVGFLLALIALGLKRPFLLVCAYAYIDIVSPQRLSYYLLNAVPVSMIVAALAIGGWALADDKRGLKFTGRQAMMLVLLLYAGGTTFYADFHTDALGKWEWVWKSMIWAIFLPFTLRTKLRIEAYLLFMTLSAAAIIIVGGIKTAVSGGGYGALNLMVDNNSGLYEGSTISTVAIALVPVILWLTRFGSVFPSDWRVKLFAYNLIFACLLIPVGTAARTGLVCIGALGILMLRDAKNRFAYMALVAAGLAIAVPMLPETFTDRMETIQGYQADKSASTRLAVWNWTWEYAQENPLGGGFEAYKQNRLRMDLVSTATAGSVQSVSTAVVEDKARAYHSSYFEMLGEQGFPGLALFLLIHATGLFRMEVLRRRYRNPGEGEAWISPLATALQNAQLIYLVGALFVGIAFQPFVYMLLAVQIGFDVLVGRKRGQERRVPWGRGPIQPTSVPSCQLEVRRPGLDPGQG
jgi:probable O-glycosylation ligase (exosortase A-associated)